MWFGWLDLSPGGSKMVNAMCSQRLRRVGRLRSENVGIRLDFSVFALLETLTEAQGEEGENNRTFSILWLVAICSTLLMY